MIRCHRLAAVASALAALLASTSVRATPPEVDRGPGPTPADATLAENLFQQGRELLAAGRHAEACPKLADSHRLDPGGGTVMALAQCYEGAQLLASAWAAYAEARAFSLRDRRVDRETRARERLAALEPRLSYLIVRVIAPAPEQEVQRDGSAIPRSAWGERFPVDRGEHSVLARAKGYLSWSSAVTIDAESQVREVEVPPLPPEPAAPLLPPSTEQAPAPEEKVVVRTVRVPVPVRSSGPRLVVGYTALGLSVASFVVGGYYGLAAHNLSRDADARCPNVDCADPRGVELADDARGAAAISTVAFGSAVVLGAGAAWLLLVTPSDGEPVTAVGLAPVGGGAGVRFVSRL